MNAREVAPLMAVKEFCEEPDCHCMLPALPVTDRFAELLSQMESLSADTVPALAPGLTVALMLFDVTVPPETHAALDVSTQVIISLSWRVLSV